MNKSVIILLIFTLSMNMRGSFLEKLDLTMPNLIGLAGLVSGSYSSYIFYKKYKHSSSKIKQIKNAVEMSIGVGKMLDSIEPLKKHRKERKKNYKNFEKIFTGITIPFFLYVLACWRPLKKSKN